MAKGLNLANLSTVRPDEAVGGGLLDDVDVIIKKARFKPVKYGAMKNYALGVVVDFVTDDEEAKEHSEIYSAGDLKNFVPTNDGDEPAGATKSQYLQLANGDLDADADDLAEMEGIAPMKLNAKAGATIPLNSNYLYFNKKLAECGFPVEEMSPDIRWMEGLRLHVQRHDKEGQVVEPGKKAIRPLIPTEYRGRVKGKVGAAKAATKTAASKKAAEVEEETEESGATNGAVSELDQQVYAAIVNYLAENATDEDEDTGFRYLPKQQVAKAVIDQFKGKNMSIVMKKLGDESFHEAGEGYLFSAEKAAYLLNP